MKEYLRIINFIETQYKIKNVQRQLRENRPPITLTGIGAKALGGIGGGVLGMYATHELAGGYSNSESKNMLRGYTGLALGTSLGIYIVGSMGNETGSYITTLFGTVAGYLPMWALLAYSGGESGMAVLLAPILGGVAGFNLTRAARKPCALHGLSRELKRSQSQSRKNTLNAKFYRNAALNLVPPNERATAPAH